MLAATLTADAASIETAEKPTDDDIKKLYKDLETLYKDKVGELCKKLCKHDKKAEKGEAAVPAIAGNRSPRYRAQSH